MNIEVSFEQPENAIFPISAILSGILIDVKEVQEENTPELIVLTFFGMNIDVNFKRPENALFPISAMLSGIVIDVKDEQSENA